jgi:hypothetical protein
MKKISAAGALLATLLASPAFAQTQERYGSMLPYHYDSAGQQLRGSWGPQVPNDQSSDRRRRAQP